MNIFRQTKCQRNMRAITYVVEADNPCHSSLVHLLNSSEGRWHFLSSPNIPQECCERRIVHPLTLHTRFPPFVRTSTVWLPYAAVAWMATQMEASTAWKHPTASQIFLLLSMCLLQLLSNQLSLKYRGISRCQREYRCKSLTCSWARCIPGVQVTRGACPGIMCLILTFFLPSSVNISVNCCI